MADAPAAEEVTLFRNGRYLRIWLIGLFCGIQRWLELLAFGVYGFDVTGSPALVALLVVLRFLPMALFGVFMGAVSDALNPLRLLVAMLTALTVFTGALWAAFTWGNPGYWAVAVAAFVSGAFWATDFPFRRKLIGDWVRPAQLAPAMSLDQATSNGTRMLGPVAGGALYQLVGIEGVFALGAILYAASIAVALTIEPEPADETADTPRAAVHPLKGAWEALKHSLKDRDVSRILAVTIVFNIWGFPFLAMIPVIGREDLELTASAIGAITSLEGLFALIGALAAARFATPRYYRALYFGATLCASLVILTMGLVPTLVTITLGLCLFGLAAAGFATMQSTLIYLVAPPAMRGRFLGLMTICIGTGVIGFANVGLTAEVVGAADAMWIIAAEGLIPLALIAWHWPKLPPRRADD